MSARYGDSTTTSSVDEAHDGQRSRIAAAASGSFVMWTATASGLIAYSGVTMPIPDTVVLIEDGRIGPAVKGATLIGNGPDALTKVTMIGNDLKLDDGVGTCDWTTNPGTAT